MYEDCHRGYISSGVIGAALILSIIIAWVAILVPSHAAPSIRSDAEIVGTGVAVSVVSNAAQKADRLDAGPGKNAGGRSEPTAAAKPKTPVGCDLAFSRAVGIEKVAVRCITSAESLVKLAEASEHYNHPL